MQGRARVPARMGNPYHSITAFGYAPERNTLHMPCLRLTVAPAAAQPSRPVQPESVSPRRATWRGTGSGGTTSRRRRGGGSLTAAAAAATMAGGLSGAAQQGFAAGAQQAAVSSPASMLIAAGIFILGCAAAALLLCAIPTVLVRP